ncbi:DUF255 domain-containing protein [Chitinophaga sp. GbtcB8]|uniref:thioredoxin family protein n=1 Tax=Chitinophaga sp. GbtcB8 TaxID=2824753 RepID=UPI001C30A706|nr:DUF255 domain-containing protein [Chitinophaga sp. GbtcB8]
MKKMLLLLLGMPFFVCAQENGIQFEENLSWQQVLQKAKAENKYIFVDCYTTWCGPCKQMEKEVYPNDSVGAYINSRFISVKMQMDKTAKDAPAIRNWYKDAEAIEKKYKVIAYPTFLYFGPDGTWTAKEIGFKSPADFMALAGKAILPGQKYVDPYKKYDRLLSKYNRSKKSYASMTYLVKTAKELGQWETADSLTKNYYQSLKRVKRGNLYNKDIIAFIADNIKTDHDPFFSLFFPDSKEVNTVMKKNGFAEKVVDRIILYEYIDPLVKAAKGESEPDWTTFYTKLENKFNTTYADKALLTYRANWSLVNRNHHDYIKYFILKVEKYGTDTTNALMDATLNNFAWHVLMHSNDSAQINTVIGWMQRVAHRNCCTPMSNIWDTYANLLYKAGRRDEALFWETKALNNVISEDFSQLYRTTINKIKRGEPTWPENN